MECASSVPRRPRSLYDNLQAQLLVVLEPKKPLEERVQAVLTGWSELTKYCRTFPAEQIFQVTLCFRDHTLSIILRGEWNSLRAKYQTKLEITIRTCGSSLIPPVAQKLSHHIKQLLQVLENPWGNPILKTILEHSDIVITQAEYDFFMRESPYMILTRLQQLYNDRCEDLALNLVTALMKCCDYAQTQPKGLQFNMTVDQSRFTFDVYLALLMKAGRPDEVQRELQELTYEEGYDLVMRFTRKRTDVSRLWRSAGEVTIIAASTFCMKAAHMPFDDVKDTLTVMAQMWLQQCDESDDLLRLQHCWIRMGPGLLTAEHMYAFCDAITPQFLEKMRYFKLQLLVRAISTDINMLERLKVQRTWNADKENPKTTDEDKASNMVQEPDRELVHLPNATIESLILVTTERIASAFVRMANWVPQSPTLTRETLLTAFSVLPTKDILSRIEESARALGSSVISCSSWKCHSHPPQGMNGFNQDDDDILIVCPKCGDCFKPLNIENALKCSANPSIDVYELVAVENPGMDADTKNDLVVLIFATRCQPLSWTQTWPEMQRLCSMFLQEGICLKNVTTDLDYAKYNYDMRKLFDKRNRERQQSMAAFEEDAFTMLPDDSSTDRGDTSDDEDWQDGPQRKKRKRIKPRKLRDSSSEERVIVIPSKKPSVPEQLEAIKNENSTKLLRTFRHTKQKRPTVAQIDSQDTAENVFPFRDTFNMILSNVVDPGDMTGASKNVSHRSLNRSVRRTTPMSEFDNVVASDLLLSNGVPYNRNDIEQGEYICFANSLRREKELDVRIQQLSIKNPTLVTANGRIQIRQVDGPHSSTSDSGSNTDYSDHIVNANYSTTNSSSVDSSGNLSNMIIHVEPLTPPGPLASRSKKLEAKRPIKKKANKRVTFAEDVKGSNVETVEICASTSETAESTVIHDVDLKESDNTDVAVKFGEELNVNNTDETVDVRVSGGMDVDIETVKDTMDSNIKIVMETEENENINRKTLSYDDFNSGSCTDIDVETFTNEELNRKCLEGIHILEDMIFSESGNVSDFENFIALNESKGGSDSPGSEIRPIKSRLEKKNGQQQPESPPYSQPNIELGPDHLIEQVQQQPPAGLELESPANVELAPGHLKEVEAGPELEPSPHMKLDQLCQFSEEDDQKIVQKQPPTPLVDLPEEGQQEEAGPELVSTCPNMEPRGCHTGEEVDQEKSESQSSENQENTRSSESQGDKSGSDSDSSTSSNSSNNPSSPLNSSDDQALAMLSTIVSSSSPDVSSDDSSFDSNNNTSEYVEITKVARLEVVQVGPAERKERLSLNDVGADSVIRWHDTVRATMPMTFTPCYVWVNRIPLSTVLAMQGANALEADADDEDSETGVTDLKRNAAYNLRRRCPRVVTPTARKRKVARRPEICKKKVESNANEKDGTNAVITQMPVYEVTPTNLSPTVLSPPTKKRKVVVARRRSDPQTSEHSGKITDNNENPSSGIEIITSTPSREIISNPNDLGIVNGNVGKPMERLNIAADVPSPPRKTLVVPRRNKRQLMLDGFAVNYIAYPTSVYEKRNMKCVIEIEDSPQEDVTDTNASPTRRKVATRHTDTQSSEKCLDIITETIEEVDTAVEVATDNPETEGNKSPTDAGRVVIVDYKRDSDESGSEFDIDTLPTLARLPALRALYLAKYNLNHSEKVDGNSHSKSSPSKTPNESEKEVANLNSKPSSTTITSVLGRRVATPYSKSSSSNTPAKSKKGGDASFHSKLCSKNTLNVSKKTDAGPNSKPCSSNTLSVSKRPDSSPHPKSCPSIPNESGKTDVGPNSKPYSSNTLVSGRRDINPLSKSYHSNAPSTSKRSDLGSHSSGRNTSKRSNLDSHSNALSTSKRNDFGSHLNGPSASKRSDLGSHSNGPSTSGRNPGANSESSKCATRSKSNTDENDVINISDSEKDEANENPQQHPAEDVPEVLTISSDSDDERRSDIERNPGSVEMPFSDNDSERDMRELQAEMDRQKKVRDTLRNVPGMSSPFRDNQPVAEQIYQVYVVQLVGAHRSGAPAAPAAAAGGSNSPQTPQSTQQPQQTSTQVTPHIQRVGQPRASVPKPPSPTPSYSAVMRSATTGATSGRISAAGVARMAVGSGLGGGVGIYGVGGGKSDVETGKARESGVVHFVHTGGKATRGCDLHGYVEATPSEETADTGRSSTGNATGKSRSKQLMDRADGPAKAAIATDKSRVRRTSLQSLDGLISHPTTTVNQIVRPVATIVTAATTTTLTPVTLTTSPAIAAKRTSPIVHTISQRIIKPISVKPTTAMTAANIHNNINCPTIANDQQPQPTAPPPQLIINNSNAFNRSICVNPSAIAAANAPAQMNIKTVLGGEAATAGSRVMQIICKSADGRLIPVTSLANRVLKVTSAIPATDPVAAAAATDGPSNSTQSTLPKFNQVFGKSVYTASCTTANSTVVQTQPITIKSNVQGLPSIQGLQTIQGGVIYTRQMPVGVGQTINIIGGTPQSRQVFRIAASGEQHVSLVKDTVIHSKMSALLAAALQGQKTTATNVVVADPIASNILVDPACAAASSKIQIRPNVNLSSTTLEQLREFDMVYKQVTERSSTSTPADVGGETNTSADQPAVQVAAQPQRISLAYVNNQGNLNKLNCAQLPLVVVSSYGTAGQQSAGAGNAAQTANTKLVTAKVTKVSNGSSNSTPITKATVKTSTPPNTPPTVTQSPSESPQASTSHGSKTLPIQPKPAVKPQEDEHTTQRIFDILAEYAEQLRNSPDLNNKPAPRRRSNPPTNPTTASGGSSNSKRKKSSGSGGTTGSKSSKPTSAASQQGQQSSSSSNDVEMDDGRTMGSEDSNAAVTPVASVSDTTNICAASSVPLPAAHITVSTTPQQTTTTTPPLTPTTTSTTTTARQLIITDPNTNQTRNLIIADGANAATAVLVPGNYLMPLSGMVKSGQQIAVVNAVGGNKILATVPAGRSIQHPANMLLFQSFLNQLPTQAHQRKTVVTTSNNNCTSVSTGTTTTTVKYALQPTPILTTNTDTPDLLLRIANRNPPAQPQQRPRDEQVSVVATTASAILPIATSVIQGQKESFGFLANKSATGKAVITQQSQQSGASSSVVRGVLSSIGRVTSVVVNPASSQQTVTTVMTPQSSAMTNSSVTTPVVTVVPSTASSAAVSVIEQSPSQAKELLLRNGGGIAKVRHVQRRKYSRLEIAF